MESFDVKCLTDFFFFFTPFFELLDSKSPIIVVKNASFKTRKQCLPKAKQLSLVFGNVSQKFGGYLKLKNITRVPKCIFYIHNFRRSYKIFNRVRTFGEREVTLEGWLLCLCYRHKHVTDASVRFNVNI